MHTRRPRRNDSQATTDAHWIVDILVTPNLVMAALLIADADIIFLPCGFFFFYLLSFFPRLISAVAEWMSTILLRIVWP